MVWFRLDSMPAGVEGAIEREWRADIGLNHLPLCDEDFHLDVYLPGYKTRYPPCELFVALHFAYALRLAV